jgi:hypothetical protein
MPTPGAFAIGSLKYNSPGNFDHAHSLGVLCVGHGGHMHNHLADLLVPRRLQSRDRSWPVSSGGSGVRRFVLAQGDLTSDRPAISASRSAFRGLSRETSCLLRRRTGRLGKFQIGALVRLISAEKWHGAQTTSTHWSATCLKASFLRRHIPTHWRKVHAETRFRRECGRASWLDAGRGTMSGMSLIA